MQFICSAIQAGSRLGYQDSAELCAEYLAPVLDAIKFNYPPVGMQTDSGAATLPKEVAYSEERLRPPPGYKDTTVPGIFSRDTPFSHRNSEPGWIVAPGMQGVQVQPFTANMLTPESLAELMGGPDIAPPPPGTNLPGPPNAYDEASPLPPPWYPQPAPPPVRRQGRRHPRRRAPRRKRCRTDAAGLSARRERERQADRLRRAARRRGWSPRVASLLSAVVLTSCGWRGIANVPLPIGSGTGPNHLTICVQMPDTLALEHQQPGAGRRRLGRHRARHQPEELGRDADAGPRSDRAAAGQRDREDRPDQPAGHATRRAGRAATSVSAAVASGDTIPLQNSSAYPTVERTLASIAVILNGGGIPNLEVIQTEVVNILDGRADQIRESSTRLDTFTAELNRQR